MFKTDIHTIFLVASLNKFLLGFLMLHIRSLTGKVSGTRYWAFGNIFTGIGLLITSFFDYPISLSNEFLFSFLLNIFIFSGDIIFLLGIQKFKDKKLDRRLWIIPILSSINVVFFTLVYHDMSIRLILNGFLYIFLYVVSAFEFFRNDEKTYKKIFIICGSLFIFIALIHFTRNLLVFLYPIKEPVTDNPVSFFLVAITGIGSTLLTYYLIIIITHKLTDALSSQIESKNKLYAIITHDLQGPVGNMVNYIEQLKLLHPKWGPNELKQWISNMEGISSGSKFLLENLFIWSRSQLGEVKVSASNHDLSKVIQLVLRQIGGSAEAKNQKIVFHNQEVIVAFFDPDMIGIVIRNILSNAIKFTKSGGEIIISLSEKINCVEIIIADNGIGISKEKLTKLFEENHPHSTYGTEREKGSGFGLLLCNEFVKQNKGQIYVTSEQGIGTEFRIVLPKYS